MAAPPVAAPAPPPPAPARAASGSILVVDDSRVARQAVETRLARNGLSFVAASARAEAEAIDPQGLAGALLDLELADGTGVDVAGRLRAVRATLPIAFLTSAPGSELAAQALAFGPVFEKGRGIDEAIAWAARCVSG